MPLLPEAKNCDISVKRNFQIISSKLGYTASPVFPSITLTNLTASKLIGTNTSKALESITLGTGLARTTPADIPTLSLSHLGIESLTDPGADRIIFWDDSATPSACKWLTPNTLISITGTNLNVDNDLHNYSWANVDATDLKVGSVTQAYHANLDSVAGLTYAAVAFVKMTGANTFVLRTLQETSDDLEATIDHDNLLNFAANEHYLQSAITTVGTIGTGIWEGTSIAVGYTDAKCVAVWPDTYTADQNLLIASSPTFVGLTLTGTLAVEGASVTVGKANTTTGTLVLHDSGSANTITLTVPNTLAGSLSFTLPPTDGANTNILQTDGNGVLTWVAAGEASLSFVIDGGGIAIITGIKGDLEVPFDCAIQSVTLLADQSGSIKIDIWKDTYGNFPPLDGDTITGGNEPEISGAIKDQDETLTDWTTALSKGDILRFNVDNVTDIQRVTLSLKIDKT